MYDIKYPITDKTTMTAPDAIFILYEIHKPEIQKILPSKMEYIIRFFRLEVNIPAVAAGAVRRASTSMIPTTLINTTTVIAISISNRYSKKAVLIDRKRSCRERV